MILDERDKKNYAHTYKFFSLHKYIFMFHLAPIILFRADEIISDLHEYIRQYKIDSIVASTTMNRKMLKGTEMEWEAFFRRYIES
jgi:predicted ATP-grasp superfamily ATP-dependent carboligase